MNQLLSDDEITLIVRECAKGSAINRDGSTSHRIARAIEAACEAKLLEQKPVAFYDGNKFYANEESASMCCANMEKLKPLFTHPAPIPEGWQPIETAPKDCAFLGYQVLIAKMWVIAPMYWSGSEFVLVQFHNDNTEHSMKPTHWQPLPQPPMATARSNP